MHATAREWRWPGSSRRPSLSGAPGPRQRERGQPIPARGARPRIRGRDHHCLWRCAIEPQRASLPGQLAGRRLVGGDQLNGGSHHSRSPSAPTTAPTNASVEIYTGSSDPDLKLDWPTPTEFCQQLFPLGDLDTDGFDDFAARAWDGHTLAFDVYLGGGKEPTLAWRAVPAPNAVIGNDLWNVAVDTGDVNGGGHSDLIVPLDTNDPLKGGRIHIFAGGTGDGEFTIVEIR